MVKIKKKWLILPLLLTGIAVACIQEEIFDETNDSPLTIEEAETWYRMEKPENAVELRAGKNNGKTRVTPVWGKAYTKKNNDYETVEAPVQSTGFNFIMQENMEEYETTKDERYAVSITRAVVRKNRKKNITDGFLMTVSPSVVNIQ